MYCIYRITNLINGKTYIGQHKYKETPYDDYMGSGVNLKRAYKKYGIENFIKDIIIANIKDKETIDKLEIKYIAYERASNGNGCYNIAEGGQGGSTTKGMHLSKERKRRLSEFWKGKKRGPFSEEHRRNLSEAHKGQKHTEDWKREASKRLKGHLVSDETKKKISEAKIGKKRGSQTEEWKSNISKALKGKHLSEEHKAKLRGKKHNRNKKHWKLVDGKRVWY